ncbi:hypothetical protein [Muriicola marianensis]|uniref:Uncharacterized protein n=1 Tax=Muriicola marianensis TaxID=1324801 RepID=A0ABQ1R0B7_9FLAO|nr:hypothetical protein [Muriicola marianensis]GGD50709.1 hypothetical protein GCM10011361_16710 [Muriicola marianensis]
MRTKGLFLIIFLVLASCGTTKKTFPVSNLAPAAEITVKQKTDSNDNNEITVKAKYLASPERVSRGATAYVVWLVSEENGIKNIGALYNENGEDSELETITSFVGTEIFITAERQVGITRPDGVEITRVKL